MISEGSYDTKERLE